MVTILNYLDTIPPLALLVFALRRGLGVPGDRLIAMYLALQVVSNGLANLLNEFNQHNLLLYHLNCLFSFLILSAFFWYLFNERRARYIVSGAAVGFALFFLLNVTLWENPVAVFNSNSFGLSSLFIVVYCLLYYTRQLLEPTNENMIRSRNFWFVTGLFTYFASNFFLFITYRRVTEIDSLTLREDVRVIWQIHNLLFFLMCVYFMVGFLCKRSPGKLASS